MVARGEAVACAEGVVWTCPVTVGLLRCDSTMTPRIPSTMTMTAATAAGMSHGGRWARAPPQMP